MVFGFKRKSSLVREKEKVFKQQARLAAAEERGKQSIRVAREREKIRAEQQLKTARTMGSSGGFTSKIEGFNRGLNALVGDGKKTKTLDVSSILGSSPKKKSKSIFDIKI